MTMSFRSNADNTGDILNQGLEAIHIDAAGNVTFPKGFNYVNYSDGGISSETGSITSGTWQGTQFNLGNLVILNFSVTINNAGTGGGGLRLGGSKVSNISGMGSGRHLNTGDGLQVVGEWGTTNLVLFKQDNTTAIANGTIIGTIVMTS